MQASVISHVPACTAKRLHIQTYWGDIRGLHGLPLAWRTEVYACMRPYIMQPSISIYLFYVAQRQRG